MCENLSSGYGVMQSEFENVIVKYESITNVNMSIFNEICLINIYKLCS